MATKFDETWDKTLVHLNIALNRKEKVKFDFGDPYGKVGISRIDSPGKKYSMLRMGGWLFLSQNTEKDSTPAKEIKRWAKKGITLEMTWVKLDTQNAKFTCRIISYQKEGENTVHYKLEDLRGGKGNEKVIRQGTIELEG